MEISLALGGGGVKGVAHIGVLRAIERNGFKLGALAGTSAGGLAGAIYLAGYAPDRMIEIFSTIQKRGLFGHKSGEQPSILGNARLEETLQELLGEREFHDLPIPFAVTAVDVKAGQAVVIDRGRIVDAVLATTALPGIFPAREWGERLLVDGGITNPIPVSVAKGLKPGLPCIAVGLTQSMEEEAKPESIASSLAPIPGINMFSRLRIGQAFQVFTRSLDISSRLLAELKLEIDKPDLIVRPDVTDIGILDQVDVEEIALRGDKEIVRLLPELIKISSWQRKLLNRIGLKIV